MVLFLEEDHYVAEDFLSILSLMKRERDLHYPNCDIICLGTYLKQTNYKDDHKKVRTKNVFYYNWVWEWNGFLRCRSWQWMYFCDLCCVFLHLIWIFLAQKIEHCSEVTFFILDYKMLYINLPSVRNISY